MQLVFGLNASPRMPTSRPTTVGITDVSLSMMWSEKSVVHFARRRKHFQRDSKLVCQQASAFISFSTNAPPIRAPGCKQRGPIFLSSPMASARSVGIGLHVIAQTRQFIDERHLGRDERRRSFPHQFGRLVRRHDHRHSTHHDRPENLLAELSTASFEVVPSTSRSGQLKSSTAQPSVRNMGCVTTCCLYPRRRISASILRAVPTGVGRHDHEDRVRRGDCRQFEHNRLDVERVIFRNKDGARCAVRWTRSPWCTSGGRPARCDG